MNSLNWPWFWVGVAIAVLGVGFAIWDIFFSGNGKP